MQFKHALVETCSEATGVVVVIDVLRAFSTAAYAFAAGAEKILLAGTVEEGFELRRRMPGTLLIGEVKGLPVEGFDLPNSPSAVVGLDLAGRTLIQRTTAGTQGMVRSERAETLLGASFCCAGATARTIMTYSPETATFVITGVFENNNGDEDVACADYIEALLSGPVPDPAPYLRRVVESRAARKFRDPALPEFPMADLEYCTAVDRFDFAMAVTREDGLPVMRPAKYA